jgi:hypothetical protein
MPLDTIGNVRRELGRLYRASLSGKLESAEAARLAFILKEVRASLEVERELHLDTPTSTINFLILSVPSGTQVDPNNSSKFIWPDGTPCTAPTEFTPYEPTPDWTALPPPAPEPSIMNAADVMPVEVELPDDPKITRLNPYRRRDDDAPGVA